MYTNAKTAQNYYARRNEAILKRMSYLERTKGFKANVLFHKLCSGFFPKFVKQLSQYLLGNGVTLDTPIKDKLGAKFDKVLQSIGIFALVDGVCWGFWNNGKLIPFRATEFFALLDERTSEPKVGVRFWQIDPDKPLYIEVYEQDGVTTYISNEGKQMEEIIPKTAYQQIIRSDILGDEVIGIANYDTLPIVPLWANELKQSELTTGLKGMIDAYDFINSDLADGITLIEGIYWVLKNYGGEDAKILIAEIQQLKATATDGETTGADSHVIEIPYQAKQTALDLLRKQMFDDFMALSNDALTGSSLTNVAINVAKTDLDLKADLFEWQCSDFVENILQFVGVTDVEPQFKRRTITNDTETVTNIYTMRADLDQETALRLNPLIPDDMVEEILDRFALEQANTVDDVELDIEEDDAQQGAV